MIAALLRIVHPPSGMDCLLVVPVRTYDKTEAPHSSRGLVGTGMVFVFLCQRQQTVCLAQHRRCTFSSPTSRLHHRG